nr:reverse transcriptase domain-containing protein [Tanacetum cinerariifolium]
LLTNKDKLFELAKVPLNENFSTMLLKKLPEKLGDPDKFLIPCDFPGMDNQAPTLGTLPSNTIPNPKVERETEETTDKEQPNCQGSIAHIQPLIVPTLIPKPNVPKTQPKPNIPYPSRLND